MRIPIVSERSAVGIDDWSCFRDVETLVDVRRGIVVAIAGLACADRDRTCSGDRYRVARNRRWTTEHREGDREAGRCGGIYVKCRIAKRLVGKRAKSDRLIGRIYRDRRVADGGRIVRVSCEGTRDAVAARVDGGARSA